jgi:hypothetical protein
LLIAGDAPRLTPSTAAAVRVYAIGDAPEVDRLEALPAGQAVTNSGCERMVRRC